MRVFLLVISFFLISNSALSSQCQKIILEKYTEDFHKYLDVELESNANKELFKSIGFQSKATEDGLKLILNLQFQELEKLASEQEVGLFRKLVHKFFSEKKRRGTSLGGNYFYPDDSEFPCMDSTLFLAGQNQCLREFDTFSNNQISKLANQVKEIYSKVEGISLAEEEVNVFNPKKVVVGTLFPEKFSTTKFSIDPTTGSSDCSLKSQVRIECDFKDQEGERVIQVSNDSGVTAKVTLNYSKKAQFKLIPIEDGSIEKRKFSVLRVTSENQEGVKLKTNEIKISADSKDCLAGDEISCDVLEDPYILKVTPLEDESIVLSAKILPENAIVLKADESKNPLFTYVSAELYVGGKIDESGREITFETDEQKCKLISKQRQIYECARSNEIYNVKASNEELKLIDEITIGKAENMDDVSLVVNDIKVTSLEQLTQIYVKNKGINIPNSSYEKLGISLSIIKPDESSSSLNIATGVVTSKRAEAPYEVTVVLNVKGSEFKKKVQISKYIAGDNFFFNVKKGNRFCSFDLMKVNSEGEFLKVGQEDFIKQLLDVKISSKVANCSDVQKSETGVGIFCSLSRKKLKGSAKVELKSNGVVVRSTRCEVYNNDFYSDYENENEDEDDDSDAYAAGAKRGKTKKKSFDHKFAQEMSDGFGTLMPELIKSRFGETQTPQLVNPLMYNYGYSPYGQSYVPGYYTSPSMWDTMYMFNPLTY